MDKETWKQLMSDAQKEATEARRLLNESFDQPRARVSDEERADLNQRLSGALAMLNGLRREGEKNGWSL